METLIYMANNINMNKSSEKKPNDGGHKPFGKDLDPSRDLVHNTNEDGSVKAYYKGSKMKYTDYIDEMQHRTERSAKGKKISDRSIGLFGGWGKGTLKSKKS